MASLVKGRGIPAPPCLYGRAGIRWDNNVVRRMWKDLGGDQEGVLLSKEKVGGHKTEVK